MMTLTELIAFVDANVTPVMANAYMARPQQHAQFCRVTPITSANLVGVKRAVMSGLGEPRRTRDGEEVSKDRIVTAHEWQCAFHAYTSSVAIPYRVMESARANAEIGDLTQPLAEEFGKRMSMLKDDRVAGILQKGTLTAGSLEYFDNSYEGQTDPYPKFGYDGLPVFDTAHTSLSGATYSNHEAGGSLSSPNLSTYRATMRSTNAVDDRGLRIVINPNTLIVPPGQEDAALRIANSVQEAGTGNNDINVQGGGRWRVISFDALTDSASSAALWLAEAGEGIEVFDAGVPTTYIMDDPIHRQFLIVFENYFGASVSNWRYLFCAGKAAA